MVKLGSLFDLEMTVRHAAHYGRLGAVAALALVWSGHGLMTLTGSTLSRK